MKIIQLVVLNGELIGLTDTGKIYAQKMYKNGSSYSIEWKEIQSPDFEFLAEFDHD